MLMKIPESAQVIAARAFVALSGVCILAFSAKFLSPRQFANLIFVQSIAYVLQVAIDHGVAQVATRSIAIGRIEESYISQIQGVRFAISLSASSVFALLGAAFYFTSFVEESEKLVMAAFLILVSFLNVDWLLIGRGNTRLWAAKAILQGSLGAILTLIFLYFWPSAISVVAATCLSILIAAIYVAARGVRVCSTPHLPGRSLVRDSLHLSLFNGAMHLGYNLPVLASSIASVNVHVAALYALIYRQFSQVTLFVPTVVEFSVSKRLRQVAGMVDKIVENIFADYLRILTVSIAVCTPVLLMPSNVWMQLGEPLLEFAKFGFTTSEVVLIKVILVVFCIEYSAHRTVYMEGRLNDMFTAASFSLFVAVSCLFYFGSAGYPMDVYFWVGLLLIFQLVHFLSIFSLTIFNRFPRPLGN